MRVVRKDDMRGHIRKRGSGTWTVVVSLGTDPSTGKRKRKWISVRGTKNEAEQVLTKILAQRDTGLEISGRNTRAREWFEHWVAEVLPKRVRPSTLAGYSSLVKNHLIPSLGSIKLSDLSATHLEAMISAMRNKGLSENTCRHAWVVVGRSLKDAERRGLVSRNVARLLDPPRVEKFEIDLPSKRQVQEIIESTPSELRILFDLMSRTGVRRGEALAIRWDDVDLDSATLSVVRSARRASAGVVVFEQPKTARGRRAVALDDYCVRILRAHRAEQLERIVGLGPDYGDQSVVFTNEVGEPIDPDVATRRFKKAAKSVGLENTRLQDLRHFHATELMAADVHPKIVQERLGHSSVAFTLDRYSHVGASMQRDAVKRLESLDQA